GRDDGAMRRGLAPVARGCRRQRHVGYLWWLGSRTVRVALDRIHPARLAGLVARPASGRHRLAAGTHAGRARARCVVAAADRALARAGYRATRRSAADRWAGRRDAAGRTTGRDDAGIGATAH